MSTRTFSWRQAMIAVLTLAVFVPAVDADFTLVSQNLTINRQDHTANFSLIFNQNPDFYTVDEFGIPANSFQYNFDGSYQTGSENQSFNQLTAIVRGDEIHVANDIRIRNPNGDGGPDSGGWGPVVTAVPFKLIGNKLSFSVPTADLGYTGTYYQYEVLSLSHGSETSDQNVTVIPLPSAFLLGLGGLSFMGLVAAWMQRRSKHA